MREQFPSIYQWVFEHVKPERDQNNRESYRKNWWIHGEARSEWRRMYASINRYIATVETSKHRFFVFLDKSILPDNMLVNIAVDDLFHLGVLSSRVHVRWALSLGGSLEDRPRYNKSVCFETFPFPDANDEQKARIRDLAEQIDAHRKRQQAEHPTLTLTNMYNVLEKLRSGEALNDKDKVIHAQALTSILQEHHDNLDRAVFTAYGWDDLATELVGKPGATTPLPDKPEAQAQAEEELLSRLVDLNTQRAAEEANGKIRWLRPDFQAPDKQASTALSQQEDLALSGVEGNDDDTRSLSAVEGNTPTAKRDWPKSLAEQIPIIREQLLLAPRSVKTLAALFKRSKIQDIENVLGGMMALGAVATDGEVYWVV